MASCRGVLCWWCAAMLVLLMLLADLGYCARIKARDRGRDKGRGRQFVDASEKSQDDYIGESANISRLLDHIQKGYDKRLRPNFNGIPVDVEVTMHIVAVSSISEVDMDYTLDMYYRQTWIDKRLAFTGAEPDQLSVSNEMLGKIWWPDTFFANSKHTKFHDVTTKNAFLRIKNTGEIYLSLRLTVTAMCNMDLTYFPMDTQICTLEIESYGYSTSDISYNWADSGGSPVTLEDNIQLPQFVVGGTKTDYRIQKLTSGSYKRLICKFIFVRSLGYYVIQIYVPSCLIVILSWVSFWLSRDAVPARVALGITTVLTMTTLVSSTNASLPKISYLKSIDVYLVTCFVMVFASLLEYAAVSYISNRHKRKLAQAAKRQDSDMIAEKGLAPHNLSPIMYRKGSMERMERCDMMDPAHLTEVRVTSLRKLHTECDLRSNLPPGSVNANYPPTCRNSRTPEETADCRGDKKNRGGCLNRPSTIDKYSRALFPLCFIVFNFMYWITYLNISSKDLSEFTPP